MFYVKNTLCMVNSYFPSGSMERLDLKENIEKRVKSGKTSEFISKELKNQNLDHCGLSARSVRSFCCDHQANKTSLLGKGKLGSIVKEDVLQVIVYVFTFIK